MRLSTFFHRASIETKLRVIILTAAVSALLLAGVAISYYEYSTFKQRFVTQLISQADLVGSNIQASLLFQDEQRAGEILQAFHSSPSVSTATVYDMNNRKLARFYSSGKVINPITPAPLKLSKNTYQFTDNMLLITRPIINNNEIIGHIYLEAELTSLYSRLTDYLTIVSGVIILALIIAFIIASSLQRHISAPLHKLSRSMKYVSSQHDYSTRVDHQSEDEVGILIDGFNHMLKEMESNQKQLRQHSIELEQQVNNRTIELKRANEDLTETIAQLKLTQQEFSAAKEKAQVTLHSLSDAVISCSVSGKINYMNPVAEILTAQLFEDSDGKMLTDIMHVKHQASGKSARQLLLSSLISPSSLTDEIEPLLLISHDGTEYVIELSIAAMQHEDKSFAGTVIVFRDVSEAHSLREQIAYQATHDALTGLANRYEFKHQLASLLDEAKTQFTSHAICYLDLDHFKAINDAAGHPAGDQLLQQVSNLMKQSVSSGDTIARLGGDEFGILMRGKDLQSAKLIADKVRKVIKDYCFKWGKQSYSVGASIGIAPINANSSTCSNVQSNADKALYHAKKRGKNRVSVYTPETEATN